MRRFIYIFQNGGLHAGHHFCNLEKRCCLQTYCWATDPSTRVPIYSSSGLLVCLQDFSIGFVLVAMVCALTFGQCGDTTHGENFFDQMRNSHVRAPPAWSYAWQMRYAANSTGSMSELHSKAVERPVRVDQSSPACLFIAF